jgi:hypothetical protein
VAGPSGVTGPLGLGAVRARGVLFKLDGMCLLA